MALDPNIIIQGRAPDVLGQQAKRQVIRDAVLGNEMNQYKLDQAKAGTERTNNLRQIFQTTPDDQLEQTLKNSGYIEERNAMQDRRIKNQGDTLKNKETEYKNAKTKTELIGQSMGALANNPSLENLQTTLSDLVNKGIMSQEEAQAAFQKGPKDPDGIKQLAQQQATSALAVKDQLESFSTVNAGNAQITQGVNPVTGAVRQVNSTPIQQSPDNIANNARTVNENALNRENSLQVAGMKQDNSAPISILGPEGKPILVTRQEALGKQPYSLKQEATDVAKVQQKSQSEISTQQALDQAALLFQHPGRKMGTGASSFMSAIPGTQAKGFQANLDTFKAQTFIPMVSALKGMGALSDAEGKKLAESVGALDPSMPEKEFEDSLKTISNDLFNKAKAAGLNVSLPDFAAKSTKKPAGYPAAKQAPDGNWYIKKGGKYFKVVE